MSGGSSETKAEDERKRSKAGRQIKDGRGKRKEEGRRKGFFSPPGHSPLAPPSPIHFPPFPFTSLFLYCAVAGKESQASPGPGRSSDPLSCGAAPPSPSPYSSFCVFLRIPCLLGFTVAFWAERSKAFSALSADPIIVTYILLLN